MKQFVWSERSKVYHDILFAGEADNLDDKRVRIWGDEPPEGRRYCDHCRRRQEWAYEHHPAFRGRENPYTAALKEMDRIRAEERVMHYGGQDS